MQLVEHRIEPLGNFIMCEPCAKTLRTRGGLELPGSVAEMQPTVRMTVVAVGPGKPGADGALRPLAVKPGDRIIIQNNAGVVVDFEGKEYVLTTADMAIAIEHGRDSALEA